MCAQLPVDKLWITFIFKKTAKLSTIHPQLIHNLLTFSAQDKSMLIKINSDLSTGFGALNNNNNIKTKTNRRKTVDNFSNYFQLN
jgi:hypothetical protein